MIYFFKLLLNSQAGATQTLTFRYRIFWTISERAALVSFRAQVIPNSKQGNMYSNVCCTFDSCWPPNNNCHCMPINSSLINHPGHHFPCHVCPSTLPSPVITTSAHWMASLKWWFQNNIDTLFSKFVFNNAQSTSNATTRTEPEIFAGQHQFVVEWF